MASLAILSFEASLEILETKRKRLLRVVRRVVIYLDDAMTGHLCYYYVVLRRKELCVTQLFCTRIIRLSIGHS